MSHNQRPLKHLISGGVITSLLIVQPSTGQCIHRKTRAQKANRLPGQEEQSTARRFGSQTGETTAVIKQLSTALVQSFIIATGAVEPFHQVNQENLNSSIEVLSFMGFGLHKSQNKGLNGIQRDTICHNDSPFPNQAQFRLRYKCSK
jgi:hypothetical protein